MSELALAAVARNRAEACCRAEPDRSATAPRPAGLGRRRCDSIAKLKGTLEILVSDKALEFAAHGAIGPRRKVVLARWGRSATGSGAAARCVGLARCRDLPSLPRLQPARASRWGGCLVLVEPNTPPEALSWAHGLIPDRRSPLQFVSILDPHDVAPMVRAVIERLYRGLESERILHAWWSGASLHVLTTRFVRRSISRRALRTLGIRRAQLRDVEVTHDGAGIFLPEAGCALDARDVFQLASHP